MTSLSYIKRPCAWLPLAMSAAALFVVFTHIGFYGTDREPDEGTAAHIWQLLMAMQIPIIAFYGITSLPGARMRGVLVLALQCGAALAALAPVYFLNL